MFTGIVEELGIVRSIRKQASYVRLEIDVEKIASDVRIGESISVNGVCLTVVEFSKKSLSFDVMQETLNVSTFKYFKTGQKVNCERALKVGDRLGWHFVSGHIDCVGTIRSKKISKGNLELSVGFPSKFIKFANLKGSIAIDGVSLTISNVSNGSLKVCLIPHTADNTTLGFSSSGTYVNLEFDMLAKVGRPVVNPTGL